ncbi:hypothetical protein ACIQPS_13360 [Streptomyces sp. NPDC091290]|uniref:hypothetical protein n=1 Tax=Streptomyces sp. NPDC091290 TaxID=3365990 RepID=UPI00380E8EF4
MAASTAGFSMNARVPTVRIGMIALSGLWIIVLARVLWVSMLRRKAASTADFLTSVPDTNTDERQRSTPGIIDQPAQAQDGLTDVDSASRST